MNVMESTWRNTPLFLAACRDHFPTVELLITHGAQANITSIITSIITSVITSIITSIITSHGKYENSHT